MRLLGKRPMAQMNKFDVILLMVLANAVQNAMNAGDNPVLTGLLLAITLMALNHLLHQIAYRSKHIERAMEGSPKVLVHNGQIIRAVADGASLTDEDIRAELRKSGIGDMAGVRWAILETDGHISVIPHHHVAT